MNQLSTILTQLREKRHLNKSETARRLGISSQLLGQYEKGDKSPKAGFFLKWKQVFGDDLLKLIETKVSHETPEDSSNEAPKDEGAVVVGLLEGNKVLNEANRTLADANKALADAHLILAKGHDELIQLVKNLVSRGISLPAAMQNQPLPADPGTNTGAPGFVRGDADKSGTSGQAQGKLSS